MTILGFKESVAAQLIRDLSDDAAAGVLDRPAIADRMARATWTGIAEPGDRIAGILVDALGAEHAFSAATGEASAAQIVDIVGQDVVTEDEVTAAIARWKPRLNPTAALLALQQAVRVGVRLIAPGDAVWPTGVDDLGPHGPIALWVRGNVSAVASHARSIALVGARAATGYGEHVAMEASAGLVDRGYAVVSGAAYGIDGMAHRAALASGGTTVAFLAGGVDRFYPSGHDALLTRIVETGAVVSELPCGSAPTKWRFLQRNRLIAAASLATVVLEAGWRSGSLNTAGHAAALGRPLGAVPGPVTSAASAGCHRLIRDFDAVCVTTPDEMAELAPLEAGGANVSASTPVEAAQLPAGAVRVIDALSTRSARTAADVAARAGLSISDVQSVLGLLELESRVVSRESGWTLAR